MQDDDAGILFGPLEAVNRRAAAATPLSATVHYVLPPAHTAAVSAWFPNRRRSEELERRAKVLCPKANFAFHIIDYRITIYNYIYLLECHI